MREFVVRPFNKSTERPSEQYLRRRLPQKARLMMPITYKIDRGRGRWRVSLTRSGSFVDRGCDVDNRMAFMRPRQVSQVPFGLSAGGPARVEGIRGVRTSRIDLCNRFCLPHVESIYNRSAIVLLTAAEIESANLFSQSRGGHSIAR